MSCPGRYIGGCGRLRLRIVLSPLFIVSTISIVPGISAVPTDYIVHNMSTISLVLIRNGNALILLFAEEESAEMGYGKCDGSIAIYPEADLFPLAVLGIMHNRKLLRIQPGGNGHRDGHRHLQFMHRSVTIYQADVQLYALGVFIGEHVHHILRLSHIHLKGNAAAVCRVQRSPRH